MTWSQWTEICDNKLYSFIVYCWSGHGGSRERKRTWFPLIFCWDIGIWSWRKFTWRNPTTTTTVSGSLCLCVCVCVCNFSFIHGADLWAFSRYYAVHTTRLCYYATLAHEFQGLRYQEMICISNAGTHGHTHQFSQSGQRRSHSWLITPCLIAWIARKTMRSHDDRQRQIADFQDSFEKIKWLYLHFKCGLKTKTHFEWVRWHWS